MLAADNPNQTKGVLIGDKNKTSTEEFVVPPSSSSPDLSPKKAVSNLYPASGGALCLKSVREHKHRLWL
jgi:hypothetical protein